MSKNELENAIQSLVDYIIDEKYKGYDPYDGLSSPIFKLPILRSNKLLRFGFQQVFRRIPINLRPILGIKKEVNPVTLGLAIQSFTYLLQIYPEKKEFYNEQIEYCLNNLVELKSKGYSGACWGYNFDWEARYAKIPAFTPTIVATGFITNGLFEYYKYSNDLRAKELILDSTKFVLNDLNRTYEGDNFCFSYSPVDTQKVFNASLKGARLLSQVYSITKDETLLIEIKKIITFVCQYQREDGSWAYSAGDARTWSDNYHTAYVLDCIYQYQKITSDFSFSTYLEKGFSFYKENFFLENGTPKYYNNKVYPIDATSGAQSILTLISFAEIDFAMKIAKWMIKNMQSYDGSFYYQKLKNYSHKTSYARWNNAWMFVALSNLLYKGFTYEKD